MMLRTLGRLALEGSTLARPKPLLLLAYLALEGARERRFLAELFWPDATDRANRLSTALSRIRRAVPEALVVEDRHVGTTLACDARRLLDAVEGEDGEAALALYRGPFVDGAPVGPVGPELEEWLWGTREYLAARVRGVIVAGAERAAAAGRFEEAAFAAEAALRLPGAPEPAVEELPRLHRLLLAGASPLAARVREEAEGFELPLDPTTDEARERLRARGDAGAAGGAGASRGDLPVPTGRLVGRRRELERLAALLASPEHRLVTLLGPGGIGKTRLALEAAARAAAEGGLEARFVRLAGATGPDGLLTAIADAVDVRNRSGDLRESLERHLRRRRLLLLLDNPETVLADAALVARLLEAAPELRVLATSRERLELEAETTLVLGPLPYPGAPAEDAGAADEERSDAVELLLERARHARPGLRPSEEDLASAERIARRVQGMPLALVLAAGWLEMLSLADVAAELDRGLELLEARLQDVPERQRSVEAVVRSSWERLDPWERGVFARLSAFRGPFEREAAGVVAEAGLGSLRTLVHKSLVYARPGGRFAVHEVLRRFGADRLAESGETEATAARHAEHFLGRLAAARDALRGPDQPAVLRRLLADRDDLVLAWRRAAEAGRTEAVAAALDPFFELHLLASRYRVGGRAFEEAAAALADVAPPLAARLRVRAAAFAAHRGEFARAGAELRAELARPLPPGDEALAREYLGHYVHFFLGELDEAEEELTLARALHARSGDELGRGRALFLTGALEWHLGRMGRAEERLQEGVEVFRRYGGPHLLGLGTSGLGVVAYDLGDLPRARRLLEEALELLRDAGNEHGRANARSNLGQVLVDLGEVDAGREQLRAALAGLEEVGDPVLQAEAWLRLGEAHLLGGAGAEARACLDAALAVTREYGFENPGLLVGFADLLREREPDLALALWAWVIAHPAAAASERRLAEARVRDLAPDDARLGRARRRAAETSFDGLVDAASRAA